MSRGMIAKALMEIGDTGMKDALQRRQQDEQFDRRLTEMSVQDQIARDRQEWMEQRAEAKRMAENERFTAAQDKIVAEKTGRANAEYDSAKGQLEKNFKDKPGDLTMYIGELEKNRQDFIAQARQLSGRDIARAGLESGQITAKEYAAIDLQERNGERQERRLDQSYELQQEELALRRETEKRQAATAGRTAQIADLQLQEAKIKLENLKSEAKIPPAVKAKADMLREEIKTINKTIYDKDAMGQLDAAGQDRLTKKIETLSAQVNALYEPYIPKTADGVPQGSVVHDFSNAGKGGSVAKDGPAPADPPKPNPPAPAAPSKVVPIGWISQGGGDGDNKVMNVKMSDGSIKQMRYRELADKYPRALSQVK